MNPQGVKTDGPGAFSTLTLIGGKVKLFQRTGKIQPYV